MAQEREFVVAIIIITITRRGPNPETCQFRPCYVTENNFKIVECHTLLQASMYNYCISAQKRPHYIGSVIILTHTDLKIGQWYSIFWQAY